jgi:hypothetical protein
VTVQQRPPTQPEFDADPPAPNRRAMILVGCAVLGTLLGLGAQSLTSGGTSTPPAKGGAASSRPTVTAAATVASFDPSSGGSGFRKDATGWHTQTYRNATFGNLKPGVGLVLDLGSAQKLASVNLDAATAPLTVQLRAGDSPPSSSLSGFQPVGAAAQASGATSLPAAAGGSHRYWMIWVTSLAPADRGFGAVIRNPAAQLPS